MVPKRPMGTAGATTDPAMFRNTRRPTKSPSARPAFTLVELLVTIVIVAVLAALAFVIFQRSKRTATRASCLSGMRQSAGVLIGSAADNSGRLMLFRGGNGGFDYRPYFVIRNELGLPTNPYEAHLEAMKELFFCPSAPDPVTPHWHCFGVNFNNNARAGVTWEDGTFRDAQGRNANVSTLRLNAVGNPSGFALVADSSTSDGQQIFRIRGSDRVALRHEGRANVAFLDGSARVLGRDELGRAGFDKAYDTSSTPPRAIDLPSNR